jgi:threonine dehydrogenase-like Zn-dependent dehydrogenase
VTSVEPAPQPAAVQEPASQPAALRPAARSGRVVECYRSLPRYLAARTLSGRLPSVAAGAAAPLRLVVRRTPAPPGPGWARVRPRLAGICGSDLATVTGRSSLYFTPLVSLPFVPGHEVVGDLLDDLPADAAGRPLPAGTRVVLDPLLTCAARGVPLCEGCASGLRDRCVSVTVGQVSPGLQTGFCGGTGGGWGEQLVAHGSQLHAVPEALSDERAVLVEPLACAVHTALRAGVRAGDRVLLVGAGAVGLLTLLALRALTPAGEITVVAKHRYQVALARQFGATTVVSPREAPGLVRRATRALLLTPERGQPYLLGGVDVALDCAGSPSALESCLRLTRAGGRVVMSGMPTGPVDLTPLWFRELELVGCYATADEDLPGEGGAGATRRSSFELALELAATAPLDGLVDASWPLESWREALDSALDAGRLGTIKTAFDLRSTHLSRPQEGP